MESLEGRIERSPLVRLAEETARRAHEGNRRKGSATPQVSHPLAVAEILVRHGFDDEIVAGALLHDVIEDTPLDEEDLAGTFPDRVLRIVREMTEPEFDEPRRETWERRKRGKIEGLRRAGPDTLAVCAADRLHNVRCLVARVRELGAEAWRPFTRGPEETLWFEREVANVLAARLRHPLVDEHARAVRELERAVAENS